MRLQAIAATVSDMSDSIFGGPAAAEPALTTTRRFASLLLALCFAALAFPSPLSAKARIIVVYQLRSVAELSKSAALVSNAIATRISQLAGYDALLLPEPAGSLGRAAASRGAETYILGELTAYDDGSHIAILSSFSAATDQPTHDQVRIRLDGWNLPSDFDASQFLSLTGSSQVQNATTGDGLLLPGGTQIVVTLTTTISSASAKAGDTFAFQSDKDVTVGDWVLIKKGAPGQGEITTVEGAGGNGGAGKLALQFDYITGADGLKIPLSSTNNTQGGEEKKGASSTATILGYALLGPLGLFAHNWVKGRQATIDPTTKLTVFIDHNVHVASTTKADPPVGYSK